MPIPIKRFNMSLSEKEKQIIIAYRMADKDVQSALRRFLGLDPIRPQYHLSNKTGQIITIKSMQEG